MFGFDIMCFKNEKLIKYIFEHIEKIIKNCRG